METEQMISVLQNNLQKGHQVFLETRWKTKEPIIVSDGNEVKYLRVCKRGDKFFFRKAKSHLTSPYSQ
jgi:hypothetical protein